jgi:sulfite exporter TauE/SafE
MQVEMTLEPLAAAFVVGLLGGTHCIGMCGGIVGALTTGIATTTQRSRLRMFVTQASYNVGRIMSYTLAGVLAGVLGQQAGLLELTGGFPLGRVIAGVIMILMGVYLAGWWHALRWLERAGSSLWKWIEPLGRKMIPVRHPGQALWLGMVWGWLPCGLVYSALTLALSSGSGVSGGAVMLAFGAGTLPTLLTLGVAFDVVGHWVRDVRIRRVAGVLVILLGLMLLLAIPGQHGHHSHPH